MVDMEFIARGGVAYVDAGVRSWGSGFKVHRSVTWPFARLRVGAIHVTVSSLFGEFRVTRTNGVRISRFGRIPVLADGVKFVRDGQDEAVIFWAVRAGRVLDELERRGWPVSRRAG
ncbi:hypothetical protein [Micromonospora sp. WMMD812]|uniref:hypothetical protein n=1 Tax=Micromonospora sp. WMMD812 TaxID=3015152 RepID=UPI00248B5BFB|nr:hypothetical protein [Micromonospora sp. WMMD812]WBB67584.1 hypothetical protein O7603_31640 [Micromonospora sp. WMMD812]